MTAVDNVRQDRRGHIALVVDGVAEGAWVDLGSVLHWWSHTRLETTPTQAREIAAALVAWADRAEKVSDKFLTPAGLSDKIKP